MDFLSAYLIVMSVSFIAMVSPGPDFLVVLKNSLGLGRKHGIVTAIGIGAGLLIHVTYCIFGIAVVISQSVMLFNIIKYAGALYLLWLGFKALKSKGWKIEASAAKNKEKTLWNVFAEGFITNALNPKATMFFLALFTQVIAPETPLSWQIVYGISIMTMATLWFSTVSLVLTNATLRQKLAKISLWIDRVTGVMLVALGVKIMAEKL